MRSFGHQFKFNTDKVAFDLDSSLFADDCGIFFTSRADLEVGFQFLYDHFASFGVYIHVSRNDKPSKTMVVYFPSDSNSIGDKSDVEITDQNNVKCTVSFTDKFKYLGSLIDFTLSSKTDIESRIANGAGSFGRLSSTLIRDKRLNPKVKGSVYVSLVVSVVLYGSECWTMTKGLLQKLETFHNKCVRRICRVTTRHKISTAVLLKRLGIQSLTYYYHARLLNWVGHVARMLNKCR
mmetsp:Transcript_26768/g.34759  ORF Transcript_26768/g.34759 Transcript_26768/m.34759 type:complete len:236 (+) Transcript_26768:387-1094(+)